MGQRGDEILARARRRLPLAARRAEETILLAKASGCRVFDADNVALLDLAGGGGGNLLGYANQYVLDAVRRAAGLGLATGFHVTAEIELAEELGEILPALAPWVLTASETEAWELALRWCRRDTGRQRVVVFDGNRRGALEAFNVAAAGPLGISQALIAGAHAELSRLVRVVPWGDADAFSVVIADVGVDTAAIILDPLALQYGVIPPPPEFLSAIAEGIRAAGARLILDETVTGLRLGRGGAAEAFGIVPDICVFGGALGGGVSPIGAVAWQDSLGAAPPDDLPPSPPPLAVVAALATLSVLRNDAVHQRLDERGAQLANGVEALAERFSRPLRCNRVGSIFSLAFARQRVSDGSSFARVDHDSWSRFVRHVRESGVLLPARSPYPCFLSHAHGVKDIEQALGAIEGALKRMQKEDEA